MVIATRGFCRSARTFADAGTVAMTSRDPSQWKGIGITRGPPSRPVYASRAGNDAPSSCCEYGLASTSATSCLFIFGSSSSVGTHRAVLTPRTEPRACSRHAMPIRLHSPWHDCRAEVHDDCGERACGPGGDVL